MHFAILPSILSLLTIAKQLISFFTFVVSEVKKLPRNHRAFGTHNLTNNKCIPHYATVGYTYIATVLVARPTSHFRRYIRASGDEWTGTGSESYAMINE